MNTVVGDRSPGANPFFNNSYPALDSTSSGKPSIKLKLGIIRMLGAIAINNTAVVTKNTVLGRLTTNLPIFCQIGLVTTSC